MMSTVQRRSSLLLWAALVLFVLAVVAVALPALNYARAEAKSGLTLRDGSEQVTLPPDQQYGIYVDDTDNSGYSEECTITEAGGRDVKLRGPGWTVSEFNTETLDYVFNTGTGKLDIDCSISAERFSTRPVPNLKRLVLGIGAAVALGCAGAISLVTRGRSRSKQTVPTAGAAGDAHPSAFGPPSGWYADPQSPDRLRYWDGGAWTEHLHSQ